MIDRATATKLLRQMLLLRRFEERCAELYTEQKIRGFLHLYVGEEAVAVGTMQALTPDDSVLATYREHGHALLRGVTPAAVLAEMFGRANGCSRGRGGSMHLFSAPHRFYGGFGIVGGGLPIAVGLALADKLSGVKRVTACYFGDGAAEEGEFHESLNLASLWKLPVLFLCENNRYAMGTALARHAAEPEIYRRAAAYRMPGTAVDGMDLLAVIEAANQATAAVRRGDGPRLLELVTYRFRAHSMYDADRYRDKEEIAAWRERDPIPLFVARMRAAQHIGDDDLTRLGAEVEAEIAAAVAEADAGPLEPVEELTRDVLVKEVTP